MVNKNAYAVKVGDTYYYYTPLEESGMRWVYVARGNWGRLFRVREGEVR